MKKIVLFIACIWLAFGLTGCVSDPATAVRKAGLKTVSVDPKVDCKAGMRYGVELSGGLANMLASAIVDSAGQKGILRMSEVMKTNNILVTDLVRDSVTKQLSQNPGIILTNAGADGTLVVSVEQFGFDNPGLVSSTKIPIILLQADIWDHKGKRVWRNLNTAFQLKSKDIGATWEQYESDPEKLRADWIQQIDHVVKYLLPEEKKMDSTKSNPAVKRAY